MCVCVCVYVYAPSKSTFARCARPRPLPGVYGPPPPTHICPVCMDSCSLSAFFRVKPLLHSSHLYGFDAARPCTCRTNHCKISGVYAGNGGLRGHLRMKKVAATVSTRVHVALKKRCTPTFILNFSSGPFSLITPTDLTNWWSQIHHTNSSFGAVL